MIQLSATAGIPNYTVQIFAQSATTPAQTLALAELRPGFYQVLPTGLAAGFWVLEFYQGSTLISRDNYYWSGTAEIDLSTIPVNVWAATTRALTDKVNFGLSAATITDVVAGVWAATTRTLTDKIDYALSAANITSLVASVWSLGTRALTAADRTAIGNSVWATTTRALTAAVETDTASRLASQNDLSAIATTAQVNAARDAVIQSVDLAPLSAAVAAVLAQATQARKTQTNDVSVNLTTGVITIFEDDGTTPFLQFQGLNAAGEPSATAAIRRERI